MHRIVKVFLLILVAAMSLLCVFVIGDETYRGIKNPTRQFDITLLIPTGIFLLSIPCFLFHLNTLNYLNQSNTTTSTDILDSFHIPGRKVKISIFLWICNLIYGLSFLGLGMFLVYILMTESPSQDVSHQFERYGVTLGFLILGFLLLADEWIIYRKYQKDQKQTEQ